MLFHVFFFYFFLFFYFLENSSDPHDPCNGSSLARAHTVYARCIKPVSIQSQSEFSNIYVNERLDVMYCHIPKVASTTFKALMACSASRTPVPTGGGLDRLSAYHSPKFLSEHNVTLLKRYNESESARRVRTYFKFMAVRHPFDRLVSAWRDKIMKINAQVQLNATPEELENFESFLQSVAGGERKDHWKPMAATCNPCVMQYDSILRLERTDEEFPLILSKLTDPRGKPNTMPTANKISQVRPSKKLRGLTSFYKNISHDVIRKLLDIYRQDFRLFGYEWDISSATGSCVHDAIIQNETSYCCQ